MRELRQDVECTLELEPPKEELDQMDEIKIEEVLMGLKGLKQEEVFSFLGKNHFTPTDTEMTSAGLGNYDQLASVDTTDMEQLQLSLSAHFEGVQGNHGHPVATNSYVSKLTNNIERIKTKIEPETVYNESLPGDPPPYGWSPMKRVKDEDVPLQQRLPPIWPRYPEAPDYPLLDYHSESLREEEIVATNIAEELISTTMDDEVDMNISQPLNTYVIQSTANSTDMVPDEPKPIKLFIKRLESEDEISDSPASRVKSKRTRQPSAKRRQQEMLSLMKRKSVKRPSVSKCKKKGQNHSTKDDVMTLDEIDISLANSVHQDDDFVYPSLDMSDDEDDVYNFSQRDDETWTPKIKMKINGTKNDRPARDRKRNKAVAKYLEAVAMKRNKSSSSTKLAKKKMTTNPGKRKSACDSFPTNETKCSSSEFLAPKIDQYGNAYILPSTSNIDPCYSLSMSSEFSSNSELIGLKNTSARKSPNKSKNQSGAKSARRIIPPKTCKLVQEPPGAKPTTLTVQMNSAKKLMKSSGAPEPNTTACSSAISDKKSTSAAYITKRGKPKKGMATAKQRLGKILKMHKMFF